RAHAVLRDVSRAPAPVLAQPQLVERDAVEVVAEEPERVDVAVAEPSPVDELDAELDRPLGRAQELVLVEVEHGVEVDDRRDRRFAHSDRADRVRFDQRDSPAAVVEEARKRRRGHPSRGSPADDDDAADIPVAARRANAIIGHAAMVLPTRFSPVSALLPPLCPLANSSGRGYWSNASASTDNNGSANIGVQGRIWRGRAIDR